MRQATAAVLVLLVGATFIRGEARAQEGADALLGQPIASVRLVADGREVTDPAVSALLDTRLGRPFEMSDVRRTIRALSALERFSEIAVEATAAPGGVAVRYVTSLVRRIDGVSFRGDLGLSQGQLARALSDRYGNVSSPRRAREMSATLAGALRDAGHLDAQVSARVEPRPDGRTAALVFDVAAGPRYQVGRATITGDLDRPASTWATRLGLTTGRPWREPMVRARAERELQRLRAAGRLEARIDLQVARRTGSPIVDVEVTVAQGPVVEVVFEGDPLPRSRLDDLVPVRREGAADEDLLEDARRRLEGYLRGEGYWQARVTYTRTLADGRLRVAFDVRAGRRFTLEAIEVTGAASVTRAEIDEVMTLRTGRPFVEAQLDADVLAVTQLYVRRGFNQVTVDRAVSEVATSGAEARVAVTLTIGEGPRTRFGEIALTGDLGLDEASLRSVVQARRDGPFDLARLEADRAAMEGLLLDAGFPEAAVELRSGPAADAGRVDVEFRVQAGPRPRVDHVILTGNDRTSARTILRELQITAGQPLGRADIVEAQRRLTALGLFRRVRIDTLRDPGGSVVDVVVVLEENAATTIGYGGGLEGGRRLRRADETGAATERFEVAPRGFVELGRRNLWGKNRSVNLFARASLRQQPGSVDDPDPGTLGIYDYRVVGAFREPRAFGLTAEATVSALVEQAVRSSFSYRRQAIAASLSQRVSPRVTVLGRYGYSYTDVYEERYSPEDKPLIDRLFPQVTLSSFAGTGAWDTRDDVIDPSRGRLVSVEAELAARAIGSDVGFLKSFTQAFFYRRLPGSRLVVAGGLRVGLAMGFPREVERVDENGDPVLGPDGTPLVDTVRDLPASERFYAGGDSTVRGFAQDRLGDQDTIDADGFPTGGDAAIIGNVELRVPLTRTLGGVVFVDAGNVFARVTDIDLARIRGTAGFGVRYKSPIGPLRVDLGFKFDRQTLGSGERERGYALHISIGQAF